MLPALSVPEIVRVMGGIRASTPDDALPELIDLARTAIGPERWRDVERRLDVSGS
jgi:hypothetical protein